MESKQEQTKSLKEILDSPEYKLLIRYWEAKSRIDKASHQYDLNKMMATVTAWEAAADQLERFVGEVEL